MAFNVEVPDLSQERVGNVGLPGVWHFDSGKPGPSVLITALVHGNELCGAWALKELLAHGVDVQNGKLTLMFCNLAAFDTFDISKHDASRFVDIDFNRVWTEARLGNTSLVETQRAAALRPWVEQADYLLDIHSMHEPAPPVLVVGTLPRNIELGVEAGIAEYVIVDPGHPDGVRMRDFAQFGEPSGDARALLIECGYHGDLSSIDIARFAVQRILALSGIMDTDRLPAQWLEQQRQPVAQPTVLTVTEPVVAASMDFTFTEPWQGMEMIKQQGTVIGHNNGQPVTTPYDNCTLVMPSLRQLIPGVTVVRLARTELAQND
ncbi:succinylglutamate desuccinylase/aspartoacylase domain-containing protein [Pollutimonas harenae]|uniref:Succinylglutamate desuccinylase/aspartoacylase family protein n=1 Tax=Pollutimonas harenae TaxID=657015 RepID=A0A853GU52_9BURK|nr:succinylglutamate desuccinylase/aspartoacylase family protein [Pollutimonas harenae]NYT84316.1 succinylglutamate desuccinylase/aspartoacylase family protein [Pollutimonas harenae]